MSLKKISLSEIVDLAAKGRGVSAPYCREEANKRNISVDGCSLEFYVEPDFTEEGCGDDCLFALISAPAAVGKTTFSKFLHGELTKSGRQVLHIPLKDEKIGENYFTGMLSSIYPDSTKKQIMDMIKYGDIILLFDGYDEVSMTYEQIVLNKMFIEEVFSEISSGDNGGGVVAFFLFRSVFYDFDIFEPLLYRAKRMRLEFFDAQKRERFLVEYLAQKRNASNASSVAKGLLEALESKIHVAGNRDAEAFFGHAIVLEAFGDYILEKEEGNLFALANSLSGTVVNEEVSLAILNSIITTILAREAGKFGRAIFFGKSDTIVPYDECVQEELLTALASDIALRLSDFISLRAKIREISERKITEDSDLSALDANERDQLARKYREELENKIDHHPFIDKEKQTGARFFRNPVYFEYYLARHLAISCGDLEKFFSGYKSPSYFFAMFFLSFLEGRNISEHKGALYFLTNLYRSSISDGDGDLNISYEKELEKWVVGFGNNINVQKFYYSGEALEISIPAGGLFQCFSISGSDDCIVIFSGATGSDYRVRTKITNGDVCCGALEFSGGILALDRVFIDAAEVIFNDCLSHVDGADTIYIRRLKSDCTITMSDFLRNQCYEDIDFITDADSLSESDIKRRLKRMLVHFRRHKRDEFACYVKKFNTWILAKGQDKASKAISEAMEKAGLIEFKQELVYLDQQALSNYGVSYIKQNEIDISDQGVSDLKALIG